MRLLECPDWSQKLVYILPCVSLHLAFLELYPLFKMKKVLTVSVVFSWILSLFSKLLNVMGES